MQRNTLLYILGAAVLTSCAEDVMNGDVTEYLNGKEKTPIEVSALLDKSNGAGTRAVGKEFEENDQLITYLRHVIWDGSTGARTSVAADQAPRLVAFTTTGSTAWSGDDITPIGTGVALGMTSRNTEQATGMTAQYTNTAEGTTSVLYWDDFSNSASADTDLRTENHYLQSYYGYCYNGSPAYGETDSHISTDLDVENGTLGWKVATNQSEGFKTSDLLWSYEQTPVAYSHATTREGLIIPYTHAMSKVTIEVVCGEGFDTSKANFSSASVILKNMNTVASLTAPIRTSVAVPGTDNANVNDIITQKIADGTNPKVKHSFAALIAPTTMKNGQVLAEIKLVDGNNYKVVLSDAVLDTSATNDWASKLTGYDSTAGGTTQPGVNYLITVTVNKQEIKVKATIQDWETVSAEGEGQILFDSDIITTGEIKEALKTNGFDLYKSTTNTDFGTKATTIKWENDEWTYSPKIYWQNADDAEYFRALSGAVVDDDDTDDVNESLAMLQGRDVLWGTTPEHEGYDKGAKIKPRTGDVPLEFEHAMSKISVELKSDEGDAAVNLTGARIDIINIQNRGAIDINTGDISGLSLDLGSEEIYTLSGTVTENEGKYQWLDNVVIPQSLTVGTDAPEFYQTSELTRIYDNGTSMPNVGGEGTYYLTSTLDIVTYEGRELTPIYADGTSKDDGSGVSSTYVTSSLATVAQVLYTQDEIDAAKALVNALTDDVRTTAGKTAGEVKTPAVTHSATQADVDAGNAENLGETVIDIPEVLYTQDEIDDAIAKIAAVTPEVDTTASATVGEEKSPEYFELLDSAIKANVGDFKCNKKKSDSEQHTPGELKSRGNMIMMYITLADNTRYRIELSKCIDSTSKKTIEEWKRGEHYTYEITLGKEEIIFRALVKEWVEKSGSGNATLDWD